MFFCAKLYWGWHERSQRVAKRHIGVARNVPNSNVLHGFKVGILFAYHENLSRFTGVKKENKNYRFDREISHLLRRGEGCFLIGRVNATGGRRNTGPDVGRGVEMQMDGRETKANNFALLLYTCIGRR